MLVCWKYCSNYFLLHQPQSDHIEENKNGACVCTEVNKDIIFLFLESVKIKFWHCIVICGFRWTANFVDIPNGNV